MPTETAVKGLATTAKYANESINLLHDCEFALRRAAREAAAQYGRGYAQDAYGDVADAVRLHLSRAWQRDQ